MLKRPLLYWPVCPFPTKRGRLQRGKRASRGDPWHKRRSRSLSPWWVHPTCLSCQLPYWSSQLTIWEATISERVQKWASSKGEEGGFWTKFAETINPHYLCNCWCLCHNFHILWAIFAIWVLGPILPLSFFILRESILCEFSFSGHLFWHCVWFVGILATQFILLQSSLDQQLSKWYAWRIRREKRTPKVKTVVNTLDWCSVWLA